MRCRRCGYYFSQPMNRCPYCGLQLYTNEADMRNISSHLVFSIMSIIFCFFPTGLIALHYSSIAENAVFYRNYYLAKTASRKAETLCLISVGIGVLIWMSVLFIIFLVLLLKLNIL